METYFVYVIEHGWWSRGNGYVSDPAQAKPFPRDAALKFCRSRVAFGSDLPALMVLTSDLTAILAK